MLRLLIHLFVDEFEVGQMLDPVELKEVFVDGLGIQTARSCRGEIPLGLWVSGLSSSDKHNPSSLLADWNSGSTLASTRSFKMQGSTPAMGWVDDANEEEIDWYKGIIRGTMISNLDLQRPLPLLRSSPPLQWRSPRSVLATLPFLLLGTRHMSNS